MLRPIVIVLKEFSFINDLNNVNSKAKEINESTNVIPSMGLSSGIVLKEYINFGKEIGKLLKSYKQLVEKDVGDIESAKEDILRADREAARVWERIHPNGNIIVNPIHLGLERFNILYYYGSTFGPACGYGYGLWQRPTGLASGAIQASLRKSAPRGVAYSATTGIIRTGALKTDTVK